MFPLVFFSGFRPRRIFAASQELFDVEVQERDGCLRLAMQMEYLPLVNMCRHTSCGIGCNLTSSSTPEPGRIPDAGVRGLVSGFLVSLPRDLGFPYCSPMGMSPSPASARTRRLISSDIHMPELSSRFTWSTTRSIKPCDFASIRILRVPQTSRPALCAIRRACLSSSRTAHAGCSNAKVGTANSPAPRSRFSRWDGTALGGATIVSHSYPCKWGTSYPRRRPSDNSSATA